MSTLPGAAVRSRRVAAPDMSASSPEAAGRPLLEVSGLCKRYALRAGSGRATGRGGVPRVVHAVEGVSFSVASGEVLAIVGETGCGKTTVAKLLVGLVAASGGTIRVDGRDLSVDRTRAERRLIQFVPQNPWSALNRRRSVRHALEQALGVHEPQLSRDERTERIHAMVDRVELSREHLDKRPTDVSGGELARLVLTRVLLVRPRLIVLDEPTASLDASVKAAVVNLLMELRAELDLSMVLITHEIPIARQLADRAAVMYLGRFVETGAARHVLRAPAHPYSRMLLASVPHPEPGAPLAATGRGEVPSASDPPPGCAYHPRCAFEAAECSRSVPELLPHGRRLVACHRIVSVDGVQSPFGEPVPIVGPDHCGTGEHAPHPTIEEVR